MGLVFWASIGLSFRLTKGVGINPRGSKVVRISLVLVRNFVLIHKRDTDGGSVIGEETREARVVSVGRLQDVVHNIVDTEGLEKEEI